MRDNHQKNAANTVKSQPVSRNRSRHVQVLLLSICSTVLIGCLGKTVDEDNPVFYAAPPRKSLVNSSADVNEQRYVQRDQDSNVRNVGFFESTTAPLSGSSVVAEVNGRPVFVDDVIPGIRERIENDPRIRDPQKQVLLRQTLQKRLNDHIDQEIVLQALFAKVPEDRREALKDVLEPSFQKVLANIKKEKNLQSDAELEAELGKEGLTVGQLRDTFIRIQMVNGYVASEAITSETIDRAELVSHYQQNIEDYSHKARFRCREIIVRFSNHGGRSSAEKVMANAVTQLNQGTDFGAVAEAFSDASTSSKKGDLGWIEEGVLADKEVESALLSLSQGEMTSVFVREDRFEVYQVTDIQPAHTVAFQEVQKEIEKHMLQTRAEAARKKVVDDLRAKASITTMFDESPVR